MRVISILILLFAAILLVAPRVALGEEAVAETTSDDEGGEYRSDATCATTHNVFCGGSHWICLLAEWTFLGELARAQWLVSPSLSTLLSSLTFYRNLVDAASAGAEYEYNEGDLDDTLDDILGTTEEGEPVAVEPTADDELNTAELEGIKAKIGEECAKELDSL